MLNFSLIGCLALNLHNLRGGGRIYFFSFLLVGFHFKFWPPGLPETGQKVCGGGGGGGGGVETNFSVKL